MRAKKIFSFIPLMLALISFNCAQHTAPEMWLAKPEEMAALPYGGWIEVSFQDAADKILVGELIAVERDTLYVARDVLVPVPKSVISKARLIIYDSEANRVATRGCLYTLATISNGFALILTAPLNFLAGAESARYRSYEPVITWPDDGWEKLAAYSRFPQGLPGIIDRDKIKMKPVQKIE